MRSLWLVQEWQAFSKNSTWLLALLAIGYLAHYHLIDIPAKKEPSEWWLYYRYGLSAISLLGICILKILKNRTPSLALGKVLIILVAILCTYGQTRATAMYPKTPFYFTIVLPLLFVLATRSSLFMSTMQFSALCLIPILSLDSTGYNGMIAYSSIFVTYVVMVAIRASQSTEIDLFIANQENLDRQREAIKFQTELSENIKAFLPKVYSAKLDEAVEEGGKSIPEILDTVLRPHEAEVIIIYSDIRRSVQNTKNVANFGRNKIFPAQQHFCNLIEVGNGVPRLTGDLVFAFFETKVSTLEEVIKICLEMAQFNDSQDGVIRYFSIAQGTCVVGNLGGSSGARDISVIGDAPNLSARIDELTKKLSAVVKLENGSIILPQELWQSLKNAIKTSSDSNEYNLSQHGLELRDFPEIESVVVLPPTKTNFRIFSTDNHRAEILHLSDFISQKRDIKNVA